MILLKKKKSINDDNADVDSKSSEDNSEEDSLGLTREETILFEMIEDKEKEKDNISNNSDATIESDTNV